MKRVIIGLSGGVDSAVAAAILKEDYEVIGITFKFTDDFNEEDAKQVAKELNIEHHVIDYRKEFKEEIIDKFIEDYKNGITPNPCVLCNKKVKLKFLYDQLIKYNGDFIATGHYAKVENNRLYKSKDCNKDQTYFLSEVPIEILSKVLFPLEGKEKPEVREIAASYNLSVANKKDSNDVCFITNSFKDFIEKEIIPNPGKIIDVNTKEVVGTHNGLSNYTIGQRRGLNIGGTEDRTFVVGKDIENNILYITVGSNDNLISTSSVIENVNWISPDKPTKVKAKFRYRSNEEEAEIEWLDEKTILVKYPQGIKAVTPGQVCVFYNKNECLGGGTIKEVRKNNEKLWYI